MVRRRSKAIEEFGEAPRSPGLYVLYGGTGANEHAAYVGITGSLRRRLEQHFFLRNSSVVTGTSAAGLNIDQVRRVAWWRDQLFDEEVSRQAAELIAFDHFDPVLRSRGGVSAVATQLATQDAFAAQVTALLEGGPNGELAMPHLPDLDRRLTELEVTVDELRLELHRLRDGV